MAQPVQQDVETSLFDDLQTQHTEVITEAPRMDPVRSFIQKCIHPPSAVPGYEGLPTNDTRTQVNIEWRNLSLMEPIIGIDRSVATPVFRVFTSADLEAFNYAYLIPNGARVKYIPFFLNNTLTTPTFTQDVGNVGIQELYNFNNWSDDATVYRTAYKSTTVALNATAFNNTGIVAGNQFNPSLLFAGAILTMAHKEPEMFFSYIHQQYSDGYLKQTSDSLHKGWTTFPKYIREEISTRLGLNQNTALGLDPNTAVQVVNIGGISPTAGNYLVPSISEIMSQSARSYGGKALDGAFSVQRLNTNSPAWMSAANSNAGDNNLYQCYWFSANASGTPLVRPLLDRTPAGGGTGTAPILRDTLWSQDMTWSWIRFDGMSTNNFINAQTQLLSVKTISGFEVQPAMNSAWSGLSRLAPRPDLNAMQRLMDDMYALKDVMPAKYNFWGALGKIAATGLRSAGQGFMQQMMNPGSSRRRGQRSRRVDSDIEEENYEPPRPRRKPRKVKDEVKQLEKKVTKLAIKEKRDHKAEKKEIKKDVKTAMSTKSFSKLSDKKYAKK